MTTLTDKVFIKDLAVTAVTGRDAWSRPSPQPITILVGLDTDFHQASVTDNLKYSLNYAVIARNILEHMKQHEHRNFGSLGNVAESVAAVVLDPKRHGGEHASVVVKSTKSEIRASSIEYRAVRSRGCGPAVNDHVVVSGLRLLTIIGVFTFERVQRQIVDIDIDILVLPDAEILVHRAVDDVVRYVENSNFKTVEALVASIGQLVFQGHSQGVQEVFVRVTKPNAIAYTDGVGVESRMTAASFTDLVPLEQQNGIHSSGFDLPTSLADAQVASGPHVAYIAFGSNVGDQVANIRRALMLLEEHGIAVEATSSLYVSKPMYHKEQADFLNGVVKVRVDMGPHQLLEALKKIEYEELGRSKEFENGPRSIDLDIVLYDEISINTADLTVPHRLMLERSFVLQPLCEVLPPTYVHPVSAEPVHDHWAQLAKQQPDLGVQELAALEVLVPVPGRAGLRFDMQHGTLPTLVMGILNTTPDSFSDGGQNFRMLAEQVQQKVAELVADGATIVDIGGVSTQPGSEPPTCEEELRRVVPVVEAIRLCTAPQVALVLVSIDTYRAAVADAALAAGADIINDVSMGVFDERIFEVVVRHGCPYVMSHSRGTPATMGRLTVYESCTNEDTVEHEAAHGESLDSHGAPTANLVRGVCRELAAQMAKAYRHGVRKWQVVADPGIGFAKNASQNIALLRHLGCLNRYSVEDRAHASYTSLASVPVLVGASRKRFLGALADQPVAANRAFATAATVTAAVQQGAHIVRVHDVRAMTDAAAVADAIYRDTRLE